MALPFERVLAIENQLTEAHLENLIAIFSKKSSEALLFVYLPGKVPVDLPPGSRMITASDLMANDEVLNFDGPIIAYPSLDAIRPDLPTKGPNFYALDLLLRTRNLHRIMYQVGNNLARFLLSLYHAPTSQPADDIMRARAQAEIISLAAPAILDQVPRRDLVALLPDNDLRAYVEGSSCRLVYRQYPTGQPNPPGIEFITVKEFLNPAGRCAMTPTIIAFPEILLELPAAAPAQIEVIDLRTALRKTCLNDEIDQTLKGLARHFYAGWQARSDQLIYLKTAYALAAESWLDTIEVDDLIGIFPANDFDQFLETGAAVYLYRQLPEGAEGQIGPEYHLSLESWYQSDHLARYEGSVALSMVTLQKSIERQVAYWLSLELVLHKADQTGSLARSAWLLGRDLVDWGKEKRIARGIALSVLLRSMTHTCALFSLENPWGWRQGRHPQMVTGVWDTLAQVLEIYRERVENRQGLEDHYYGALVIWHGCVNLDPHDIEAALHEMVMMLHEIEQNNRRPAVVDAEMKAQAEHLYHFGRAILDMMSGGAQPEIIRRRYQAEFKPAPRSVSRTIAQLVDMNQTPDVPSPFFAYDFQRYATMVEKIQRIRASEIPVDYKISELRRQAQILDRARRTIFALRHEERILDHLYSQVIKQTNSLADDLAGQAQLEVEFQTDTVAQHDDNTLTFLVRNIGRVAVEDVEVELLASDLFQLREATSVKETRRIDPYQEKRFAFIIRPVVGNNFRLQLRLTHSGRPRLYERLLRVISLDQRPFQEKPNPYIYGIPLENYHQFYGRRQELKSLLQHLAGGRSQDILLRGARRTGKTSILNMVQAVIDDRGGAEGVRAYFDVPPEWFERLDAITPVALNLQSLERQAGILTPRTFYRGVLDRMVEAGLKCSRYEQVIAEPQITAGLFTRVLTDILAENQNTGIVMLIDEFDIIDTVAEKAFYAHLRHIISTVQAITWIVASAMGLHKAITDYESPLFNVFKIMELRRLDREAAQDLIVGPWQTGPDGDRQQSQLQFTGDAVDAILHETGCHPYFIQFLCSALIEYVNIRQTNYILRRGVYERIEELIEPNSSAQAHFAYLWDQAGGMGKLILLSLLQFIEAPTSSELAGSLTERLTRLAPAETHLWQFEEYTHRLEHLKKVEAISLDRRNRLIFGIPLFRSMLRRRSEGEDLWLAAVEELRLNLAEPYDPAV